jgi:hypothetical protein
MTKANHSTDFAFGSADHKVRIFETKKAASPLDD